MQEEEEDEEDNQVSPSVAKQRQGRLDSCSVQVYPPLNPDHERFQLPSYMMAHLGIHHRESKDGLVIYGKLSFLPPSRLPPGDISDMRSVMA